MSMVEEELMPTKRVIRIIIYVIAIWLTIGIIAMYAWLFVGSFSEDIYGLKPTRITLENWKFLKEPIIKPGSKATYPSVWKITFNTLYLALATTFVTVMVSSLGGYALSRLRFRWRGHILALILILHAFPGIALLVALFYVINYLGLYGNIWSVVLSKSALMIPLGVWVMKGFFDIVPWDIEMSALVDGLSRTRTFFQIMLPLVRPGLAALAILTFISAWGEYILVLVFLTISEKSWTLAIFLQQLAYQALTGEVSVAGISRGMIIAVGLWYMLPIILFFIFTQKYLLQITGGGVKGY